MLRLTPEIRAFRASKTQVEAFRVLMADPIMKEAIRVVATIAQPRSVPAFQPGTPHDTTIAHDFCEMVGVNTILLVFDSMKYHTGEASPLDQIKDDPEPFEDNLPENLRKPPSLPQSK